MKHVVHSECNLELREDSILRLWTMKKEIYEDQYSAALEINNNNNNKAGTKALSGGLLEEIFFSLSHALKTFQIK